MASRRRREEGEGDEGEALYAGPDSSGMAGEGDVEVNGGGARHKGGGGGKGKRGGVVEGEKENLVGLFRALSRKLSSSVGARDKEDDAMKCLICLEPLTEEDFASGEAITLQCQCKGDIALRHKACAVKWASVKGSLECDICKATIRNLPDLEEMPVPDLHEPLTPQVYLSDEQVPPALDLSFDFLRITWMATILCVVFVDLDLQSSLTIGSLCGLCYVLVVKLVQACSRRYDEGAESVEVVERTASNHSVV
ncbi:RING-CH-type domain-containing protein [Chloropicon primus]|uniref:RING-CH-type domain-containing protein n=1 Tax=Chloropicon primus TaxID=1764295 RepID=A0A5B8MGP7_9CHLO|nr:hypothetical protein A3770_03p21210 [Chloropicon primus]UPQ98815.1 RING-CH-type domain-containing protein [Chloropicon primus]|eukprot:QDZ19603.1 hypothetical protein A3770_03p21210 [Chloropicon primus]